MSDSFLLSSPTTHHHRYWNEQGETLLNLGHYLDALDCFERSLEIHPTDPNVWVFKGVALIHLMRCEDALAALDQALLLSPRHTEALIFRGAALNHLHRYSESYESYEQALRMNRHQPSDAIFFVERIRRLATSLYMHLMFPRTP